MRATQRQDSDEGGVRGYWKRGVEWLLLYGSRGVVALVFGGAFGLVFVALSASGAMPLGDAQALLYAYSGLISGNLTLITVAVSINQLLLSRELNAPDELRPQIESVVDYREDVEEAADQIAPVKPLGFLRLLVETTRGRAQRLGGLAGAGSEGPGHDAIDDIVTTLTVQMDDIDALIEASDAGTFSVLSTTLETNYAEQINGLRTVQANHGEELSGPVDDVIEDLVARLKEIDVARQYFKSIYLQQELSALSRLLLVVGLPAVGTAIATLLLLTVPPGRPSGVRIALRLLVPVTLTIGVLPLSILCAVILRTATVTRRTAATLPFTTPEQER